MRDNLGFITLENLQLENISNIKGSKKISFIYDNKKYYYKSNKSVKNVYYELIAEELSKDYGINNAHYDLATYMDDIGVISENFIEEGVNYFTIEELLKDYCLEDYNSNNLKYIELCLKFKYQDREIVSKLMEQLINIFIFDVLIGNSDRHSQNLMIIENGNDISFSKLYDNENMLSYLSILEGYYSLGVTKEDFETEESNTLRHFLDKYKCIDLFIEKKKIISEENIIKVIARVEERIGTQIPDIIKNGIIIDFKDNNRMIDKVLSEKNKEYKKEKE